MPKHYAIDGNFLLSSLWLPKISRVFGGVASFWIIYAVILAIIVLCYYFYHELHELAGNFSRDDSPFTSDSTRRVRNVMIAFFILSPSVLSLLMIGIAVLLIRYAFFLQTDSDYTV